MKPVVVGAVAVLAVAAGLYAGGVFETEDPGPAEQAGAQLDDAMDQAGDALQQAGEAAGEAAEDAAGALRKTTEGAVTQ